MRHLDHFFLEDAESKRRANREIAAVCAFLALAAVFLMGVVL
jgi:hypothetical protein